MFTGLIEEVGTLAQKERRGASLLLTIRCHKVLEQTQVGDSIAVNGACLTVTHLNKTSFTADAIAETISRTQLHRLSIGSPVNLERALRLSDRLGGHLVQGHVDGSAKLLRKQTEDQSIRFTFQTEPELTRYMIQKGSIAIDGISLTLTEVKEQHFSVAVIPHSLAETTMSQLTEGDFVNIECDLIGKYVAKLLHHQPSASNLTWESLKNAGFFT